MRALLDRSVAVSVDLARAVLFEGFEMLGGGVSEVATESIFGKFGADLDHVSIAGDLCENGCGGYFSDFSVAFDDGFCLNG